MEHLTSVLTGGNAALVTGIVTIISSMRAASPKFFNSGAGKIILPILPLVIGIGAVFLGFGEAADAVQDWQDKAVLGVVLGFSAGQLFKAGKNTMIGAKEVKEEKAAKKAAKAAPLVEENNSEKQGE